MSHTVQNFNLHKSRNRWISSRDSPLVCNGDFVNDRTISYPSIITERNGMSEITFPKVLICSHSMHSKKRLRKYYPQITGKQTPKRAIIRQILSSDELLRKFYGQAKSKRTREFWNKLVISNVSSGIQGSTDQNRSVKDQVVRSGPRFVGMFH